jgi:phospholipid/cholesterol/gamma-HCH transport system substrate-binding protein
VIKPRAALWRVVIAAIVSGVLLIMISNELSHPVQASTAVYNAEFTDVSGLMNGADVRVRGVRVGKVEDVALQRSSDGRSLAAVRFTLDKRFGIVSPSRLAIRYQALTGLRYMDVQNPAEGEAAAHPITQIPTTMTIPSFDITVLFNGLQPVLATLSPDDINTFTDNAISFLQGDGGGLQPMLDSIHKLTEFVSSRQEVVAAIVRNLSTVADEVNGRSEYLGQFLDGLDNPIRGAMSVLDEFRKSQVSGADFTRAVAHLLAAAGVRPGIDTDTALDRSVTNVYSMLDVVKRTPVIWDNLPPPPEDGTPIPCSKGRVQLPETMDVLLNGQRVVLCNK